ncbi:MAG: hypothetical protein NDJ94_16370 [Vicinamibacteria bacterium]|nr:hypothetical protein [Vicinamibacteria bacterium]
MKHDPADLRFALERALGHAEDAVAILAPFSQLDGPPPDELAQAAVDVAGELDGFAGAIELALARGGGSAYPGLPWELMAGVGADVLAFDDEGRAGLDPEAAARAGGELLPPFVAAIRRALAESPRSLTPGPTRPRSHPPKPPGRRRR